MKKRKPLILSKIGHNTCRPFPTTWQEIEWEMKPNEIIIDPGTQSIKSIMDIYPDYEVKNPKPWR